MIITLKPNKVNDELSATENSTFTKLVGSVK